MTEEDNNQDNNQHPNPNEVPLIVPDELEQLKLRADRIGLKYHHRVGAEKLKKQIDAAIAGKQDEIPQVPPTPIQRPMAGQPETPGQRKTRKYKEAAKLVRVRIACMNPGKREWEGEIFTVSNALVGTFRKFVPYNNDNGWHIPNIMYKVLRDKDCQIFVTKKNHRGNKVRESKMIKEFNIEILPELTKKELQELAQQQAMRAGQAA